VVVLEQRFSAEEAAKDFECFVSLAKAGHVFPEEERGKAAFLDDPQGKIRVQVGAFNEPVLFKEHG